MNSKQKKGGRSTKKSAKPRSKLISVESLLGKANTSYASIFAKALSQGASSYMKNQNIPAAAWTMTRSFLGDYKNITSKGHLKGIRITGSQFLYTVSGGAGGTGPFNGAHSIRLTPQTFSGPLGVLSSIYRRYYFRKMSFRYVSACSTTQANSLALAWENDPNADTSSFDNISEVANRAYSSVQPIYNMNGTVPAVVVDLSKSTDEPYYTDYGGYISPDDAERRQDFQGLVVGCLSTTPGVSIAYGYLLMDYVLDLLDQSTGIVNPSAGLTSPSHLPEENRKRAIAIRNEMHRLYSEYKTLDHPIRALPEEPSSLSTGEISVLRTIRAPLARSRPCSPEHKHSRS